MKKILSLLLCLMILAGATAAADTVINGGENRGIKVNPVEPNEWEDVRVSRLLSWRYASRWRCSSARCSSPFPLLPQDLRSSSWVS